MENNVRQWVDEPKGDSMVIMKNDDGTDVSMSYRCVHGHQNHRGCV